MISIKYDELIKDIDSNEYQEIDKTKLESEFSDWLKKKNPSLHDTFIDQRSDWERISLCCEGRGLKGTELNMWFNLLKDKEYTSSDSEKCIIEVRKMWKEFRLLKCPTELKANQHPEGVPQGVGGIAGTDEDVIRQRRGNFGPNAY